jgi:hypothetical protein
MTVTGMLPRVMMLDDPDGDWLRMSLEINFAPAARVTRFPRRQKIHQGQPVAPRPICTTSVGRPSAPRVTKQNLFPLT